MPKKSAYPRLRVHVKRGKAGQCWVSYWYDMRGTGEPDVKLGTDRDAALKRWDELHNERPRIAGTLEEAFRAWEKEVLPAYVSAETRKGYARNLKRLRVAWADATWDGVTLVGLKGYLKKRSAKTQGNRELAVLSIIWNWARTEGYTDLPWPAHGMERSRWKNAEGARDVEVSDVAFDAIYRHAGPALRDALDLATATGMRIKDCLKVLLSDIRGDVLLLQAGKTGKRTEFVIAQSDVLPGLIERRRASKALHLYLLTSERGKPLSLRALQERFTKAREEAAKECPEAAEVWLRDMRKRAAQLAGDVDEASALLQHSSTAVTRRHYRNSDRVRPVR